MVVGLYFGSFNPVHKGHVHLARAFQEQSGVDEVWWVLSPHNPFKQLSGLASFEHRAAMLQEELPNNHMLCTIEQTLPRPSFTIQTLRALQRQFPENQWILLMGADSWNALPTWKDGPVIEAQFPIWVYPRISDAGVESILRQGPHTTLEGYLMPVSSTEIRQASIDNLEKPVGVSDQVWEYILDNQLYQPVSTRYPSVLEIT